MDIRAPAQEDAPRPGQRPDVRLHQGSLPGGLPERGMSRKYNWTDQQSTTKVRSRTEAGAMTDRIVDDDQIE